MSGSRISNLNRKNWTMNEVNVYDIPQARKNEIIKYCYSEIKKINKTKLVEQGIPVNLFLELMFDLALHNNAEFNDFTLTETDYRKVYAFARNMEIVLAEYICGERELLGIDDDGHYIFNKQRKLLEG